MTEDKILSDLTTIFRDILDDDDLIIAPETTADDVKDWDSANHINLVVATEMKFKVRFNSAEVETLKNVGDLVRLIALKTSSK
jgi:acyl carrier protein